MAIKLNFLSLRRLPDQHLFDFYLFVIKFLCALSAAADCICSEYFFSYTRMRYVTAKSKKMPVVFLSFQSLPEKIFC